MYWIPMGEIISSLFISPLKNNYDHTLHLAAGFGYDNVAETLIVFGSNIAARCNGGKTALVRAAMQNCVDVVRILLQLGANTRTMYEFETLPCNQIKTMLKEYELKSVRLGFHFVRNIINVRQL